MEKLAYTFMSSWMWTMTGWCFGTFLDWILDRWSIAAIVNNWLPTAIVI